MATAKAIFLFPVRDNDGRDLRSEIAQARLELWVRFTAYTVEGKVEGVFQMSDGAQAADESEKYALILEEERIEELEQVLRDFKQKTTQEKIYLEIQHNVDFRLI